MKAGIHALGAVALATMTLLSVSSVSAEARVFVGTKKANKVTGTKKGDTIRLGAGNDRARGRGGRDRIFGAAGKDRLSGDSGRDRLSGGRGNDNLLGGSGNDRLAAGSGNDRVAGGTGNDRVSGNSGRDRLSGGKGRDRLAGGSGNDYLNAADGRKDASVDGGTGRNKCRLDAADLSIAHGCGSLTIQPGGTGNGTGGGPGGAGGPGGSGGGLELVSGSGLQCGSQLATCTFTLSGQGADALTGTVTGGDGVTGAGGAVSVSQDNPDPNAQPQNAAWTAGGSYGCTSDGFLRVTIGSETLDVPVDCTV